MAGILPAWRRPSRYLALNSGGGGGGGSEPTAGLSPVLWYDFADQSKVTLSGTDILSVSSKGTRNWTLTSSSTKPSYVTGINGKKCIDWGSAGHSNYMRNTDSTATTVGEIYAVVDANFGGNVSNFAGLCTNASDPGWYLLALNAAMYQSGTAFDTLLINGGSTNRFSSLFSSPSIDSPAILQLNSSTAATFSTASGFQIGNDRTNGGRGWGGLVGEYIVFSAPLGTGDKSTLLTWLASKWGITLV